MSKREQTKRRLSLAFTKMLRACEQTIRAIEWWNTNRTECPPMDAEWFKVQAAGLRKCLRALDLGQRIEDDWLQTS